MSGLKVAAIVIVAGSVVFLVAAFLPVSRVYALDTAADKMDVIRNAPVAWGISQALFSAGAIVTTLGVGLGAFALRERVSAPLLFTAVLCLIVGTAVWSQHTRLRALDPTGFVEGTLPGWHFPLYTVLTLTALFLLGRAVQLQGLTPWSGWLLIAGSLFLLLAYIIFGDLPPFLLYLLTMVVAYAWWRGGQWPSPHPLP